MENCRGEEKMAKQISERRRRSRSGSNLNVNFNGGGVVLLLGAAAGALLASAFAAHRIRAFKKRRGSMTEGIQGDSGEHVVSKEEKEFVGIGGAGGGAGAGEGVVQVNSDDNLNASLQLSEVDRRELGFYLLEEGKGEVAEKSPIRDIELIDGERGELTGFRDSSADISGNLVENQLRYDDEELVATSVEEDSKTSCIKCKEDDEEDKKKAYLKECGEREEIEEKMTSSNLYSAQPRLLKENFGNHLHPLEAAEFVEDEKEVDGGSDTRDGGVQVSLSDDIHASLEIKDFVKRESNIYLVEKEAERSSAKEIELVDGVEGELACLRSSRAKIGSSPANVSSNLVRSGSLGDLLKYGDQQLVADSVKEEGEMPCKSSKEDEEENTKKAYLEEWSELEELEEKITPNLNTEELCLLEKKTLKNLEIVKAIEERNFEDGFKDEKYNSILEFVLSRANEKAASSPFGDQDEMNPLIEEIEPFFEGNDEAKKALDMTQNDSGKHLEMVEDKIRLESGCLKNAVRLDILCVEQDNEEGDASDDKMVEGSRRLCEQTVAPPHESSLTAISELETSSCKDSLMVMTKKDVHLIAHINGIVRVVEDKKGLEESNYPSAEEGVEGLMDEIQGTKHSPIGSPLKEEAWPTESHIRDNPAMIMAVEEKIQLEDNATCDPNDVIQEEKTEENLLNGLEENVESSETEENHRENTEWPLTESQRIDFSLEQDNLIAYKESPLIQFQGIEPIVTEERACLEDSFPLPLELNMKIVQPIQDNNSKKTLERKECHLEAGSQEPGTSPNEVEREDEIISVQYHGLEIRQYIESFKDKISDKLENEIEYPQIVPVVKKGVGEIHQESQAEIKEEEEEEEQSTKLSFDVVEKGVKIVAKTMTELIDVDKKHQRQVEGHEKNVSSKGKRQRITTKKVKRTEYMFMGYPKGHIFLVTTLATAIAVLAFLYTKDFVTRTTNFEKFITG